MANGQPVAAISTLLLNNLEQQHFKLTTEIQIQIASTGLTMSMQFQCDGVK